MFLACVCVVMFPPKVTGFNQFNPVFIIDRHILISEALIELTEDETIWQGDTQDERLRQAYVQFTAECRQHRVRHLVASGCALVRALQVATTQDLNIHQHVFF